jgi:hypothetical protein
MTYLQINTASQMAFLTLKEGHLLYSNPIAYYLLEIKHETSLKTKYCILNVLEENDRYTKVSIGTDVDDALNSAILIEDIGRWSYIVYGQDNNTNLDPTDSSVIGIVEKGYIEIGSSAVYFKDPTLSLPEDVIYNG